MSGIAVEGACLVSEVGEIAVSYIAGRWCRHNSAGVRTLELYDPSLGTSSVRLICAGKLEVDAAVDSANRALQGPWRRYAPQARMLILHQLVAAIERRREMFVSTIAAEMGAPIDYARREHVTKAFAHIQATLDALNMLADTVNSADALLEHQVRYERAGVVALITPWNWPLNQIVVKVGAAIAAGCTMVLKPSELTPETSLIFAECVHDTDLPDGVFNMVLGDNLAGTLLASHPDVSRVSFTGSTETGLEVARLAAVGLKPVVLELGGKSPTIVFEDVNVEVAVNQAIDCCFRNSGQTCNAGSRLLVHQSIYDQVIDLAYTRCAGLQLGSAHKSGSHLGPVASEMHKKRILTHIANAVEDGAVLICGSDFIPSELESGSFVRPTIFADVRPEMRLFQDEVFGPVLAITSFKNEEEAIALANNSRYGLAAYVHTTNLEQACRVTGALDVGMVQINGCKRLASAPFGGRKGSGMGVEAALWGIRSFQAIKSISGVMASAT